MMADRIEQAIEAAWKSYTAGLRTLDGDYAVIRAVVEDALAALLRCDNPRCYKGEVMYSDSSMGKGGPAGQMMTSGPCPKCGSYPHVVLAEQDCGRCGGNGVRHAASNPEPCMYCGGSGNGVVVLGSWVETEGEDRTDLPGTYVVARLDDE